jgi:hypothetical protein
MTFRGHTKFAGRSRIIVVVTPGDPAPAMFSVEVGFGPRGQEEIILTASRFGEFTMKLPKAGLVSYRYQVLPTGATIDVAVLKEIAE